MKKNIDPFNEEDWDDEKPKEIVELVKKCKLVRTGYEDNGHDCWGNYEYSSYKYVMIEGKEKRCWDDWIVIHDGKKVKRLTTQYTYDLEVKQKKHFEETGFKTPAEYKAYLKGKEEILKTLNK